MQPVTIRLGGEYWDSFVYDGHLYLFTREGSLEIYRWDSVVEGLDVHDEDLRVPLRHIATRGKAWYGLAVRELLRHRAVDSELKGAAEALSQHQFFISRKQLLKHRPRTLDVGTFPTTDVEIYVSEMFLGSSDGVVTAPLADIEGIATPRGGMISDAPTTRVAAGYGYLAAAHGPDGLSERPVGRLAWEADEPPAMRTVSTARCDSCSWASFDLVASTPGLGGYVSAFTAPTHQRYTSSDDRNFLATVDSEELFGTPGGVLIGSGNLLVLATEGELMVERWNPYRRRPNMGADVDASRFAESPTPRRTRGTEPIDAGATVFGVVLELDNRLVIHGSDGIRRVVEGEPVSWRVFPRSERYINHLHVVRSRSVDVIAYVHDYFVADNERSFALERPKATSW